MARSKNLHLLAGMPKPGPEFDKEVERRFAKEDLSLRASVKPRPIEGEVVDLRQRVMRKKRSDELLRALPLINCGLCGAPTCKNHAEDVAALRADLNDCVFLSRARIDLLRKIYKK